MTEVSPSSSAQMLPFTISPALILSLLESEATTLIRAVAEAIMNAVDAGATRIDVRTVEDDWLQVKQLVIQDDGRGMDSREEIATHFQTLGFDHRSEAEKALGRTYGTFGLGRMQLFRFGAVTWRTHSFAMQVDLQRHDLAFTLQEDLPFVPGMRVEVALKSDARMTVSSFLEEFRLHFAFLPVPLFLNGVEVRETVFPWTHQSEEGDYLLDGRASLALYNVGVLVGQFGTQVFGSGGVINTRRSLKLNVSRTVSVHQDAYFLRLRDQMRRLAKARLRTLSKYSTQDIAHCVCLALEGQLDPDQGRELPLLVDVTGRTYTLGAFLEALEAQPQWGLTPHVGSLGHDKLHQLGLALVLAPESLTRVGVTDLRACVERLKLLTEWWALDDEPLYQHEPHQDLLAEIPLPSEAYERLPTASLTVLERLTLQSLQDLAEWFRVWGAPLWMNRSSVREMVAGECVTARAWTDGRTYVAFRRSELRVRESRDFMRLALLLAHELCHQERSDGSHVHDGDFYARYHDLTCTAEFAQQTQRLGRRLGQRLRKGDRAAPAGLYQASGVRVQSLPALVHHHRGQSILVVRAVQQKMPIALRVQPLSYGAWVRGLCVYEGKLFYSVDINPERAEHAQWLALPHLTPKTHAPELPVWLEQLQRL